MGERYTTAFSPMDLYAGPVFAGLLDWLMWGRLPDLLFLGGAAVVTAPATLALRPCGGSAPVE